VAEKFAIIAAADLTVNIFSLLHESRIILLNKDMKSRMINNIGLKSDYLIVTFSFIIGTETRAKSY